MRRNFNKRPKYRWIQADSCRCSRRPRRCTWRCSDTRCPDSRRCSSHSGRPRSRQSTCSWTSSHRQGWKSPAIRRDNEIMLESDLVFK